MKLFKKQQENQKSWALDSKQDIDLNSVYLLAVDSETGEEIAYLQQFSHEGEVITTNQAKERLEEKGYNPYEHGNEFDSDGAIIVRKSNTFNYLEKDKKQ